MPDHNVAPTRYDVAVIGYGPTGATLAILLAKCGLSVVVLDRESDIYHLPRAVHFDDETMRVFQSAGIGDALRDKIRVNPGMRFVDEDDTLLLDWPRPQDIGPQGWNTSFRLHQPDLETLLRRTFGGYDQATILTNCDVNGVDDTGDEVRVAYRNKIDDSSNELRASYVVGCDGARSLVRQAIGSEMDDLGFRERWLVLDLLLTRDRPDLGDHTVQFCNPDRPMTYCRNPGRRRRWEIRLNDTEPDQQATDPGRAWELLSRWIGPDDAELERAAVYTFHSAIADRWRRGRIMIAGDAAHLTPPFMGQGMCAGIRDAANLAWKLALQVTGAAHPTLLDSYQAERVPHVRDYITTAVRLGGLINALDKDGALELAKQSQTGSAKMASIAPRLGASDFGSLDPTASDHRGRLFGQPILKSGDKMDDVYGYAPILILRNHPSLKANTPLQILNGQEEPSVLPFLDDLGVDAVLIRPDRYIMATARGAEDISKLADFDLLSKSPAGTDGGAPA